MIALFDPKPDTESDSTFSCFKGIKLYARSGRFPPVRKGLISSVREEQAWDCGSTIRS